MTVEILLKYSYLILAAVLGLLAVIVSLPDFIRDIHEARRLGIPVSEVGYYKLCQRNGWRYRNKVDRAADLEAALTHRQTADERCIHRNATYKRRAAVRQRVKKKLRRLKL